MSPFSALARLVRGAGRPGGEGTGRGAEQCELCAAPIADRHEHVVELEGQTLRCACQACGLLFSDPGSGGGRFATVPDRVLFDPSFQLDEVQWAALGIPVRLAFVVHESRRDRWALFYPSPAGAIEAELPVDVWAAVARRCPLVAALRADVEALLVHRPRGQPTAAFVVPLTDCYELSAKLRRHFVGFAGGDAAEGVIAAFFAGLSARSRPITPQGES